MGKAEETTVEVQDEWGRTHSLRVRRDPTTRNLYLVREYRPASITVSDEGTVTLGFGGIEIVLAAYAGARTVERRISGQLVPAAYVDEEVCFNTCSHPIVSLCADGTTIFFPKSFALRSAVTVSEEQPGDKMLGGVPLLGERFNEGPSLPVRRPAGIYIVPSITRRAVGRLSPPNMISPEHGNDWTTGAILSASGGNVPMLTRRFRRFVA
ncbi:hypothetical protein KSX_90100 [Ktedonospora formicarum]|uniref:Uncharacterized protein n=1 Tax=Ktedonospora formicarum TaxID=2778364 RepID=A0A8J3MVY3_9CHLR|nr:hypothetical protein KSX_90100 [Ktedonospora formicarum]